MSDTQRTRSIQSIHRSFARTENISSTNHTLVWHARQIYYNLTLSFLIRIRSVRTILRFFIRLKLSPRKSLFIFLNFQERDVQIYFGNSPAKLIRNVESIHEHEQFNPTSHVNDIALLKLATPLLETNPIPMPIYNRDKLLMQNDFIMPDVIREAKFLSWRGRTMRERKLESIPHQLNQKPCVNMKYNQFICSESLDFRLNDEPPRKGRLKFPVIP